ncbi:septation protein IspZ [Plebeiibacterium marinum]|uniref:Septation protein IspZ n=1 Tax=Plebeiibacterium marinum TaxID=2992111 RepID=A0AAE3MDZ8_9BACT|nr:septation protein IspZ [Plebeiobacterium marinum]MCW3805696.1 septation protein IspZ [Plebeiobacterium marinum]
MNQLELIKKLLPGLAPLIVFVVVDGVWGTKEGLIVAIGFGLSEIAYRIIKKQKPDKFILFDVGLLVAMGGISLLLDNDLFFKLKPGVIGVIFSVLLGISAYGKYNVMMAMGGRYMKGIDINPWQQYEFVQSIKALFWIFTIHTILVFASAILMSKETWIAISGPGFYVLFGIYFVFEVYNKKRKNRKHQQEEWLPIVDKEARVLGKMPRSIAHNGSKILHPVVHLHVFNTDGELYLQKRPAHKLVQPNKWDTAVGGHVAAEELIEVSLKREAAEEIGLLDFEARSLGVYVWESEMERELVFVFTTTINHDLNPDGEEVEQGKFWSENELEENFGKHFFTPNFEHEYKKLKKHLY